MVDYKGIEYAIWLEEKHFSEFGGVMSVNYKSYEFRVYEHISQLDKLLHEGEKVEELRQWQSDVEKLRRDFETKHFRVAVVGEFNRGKTTFVNALLGREILPADYLPTTAAISRITYGDTPGACIIMKDGQRKSVPIEELAEHVTKLSVSSAENAARIQEAVVEYPSLFCRNGVDLIDTPGMNDEDDLNQVTISRLEGIDLAIVAVDATLPFSMTECAFTVQLLESPQVCQIVIVVTKIDMIRERERQKLMDFMMNRIREDVRERLLRGHSEDSAILRKYHNIFDSPHVFAVSGVEALEALSCNDMELFEKSGFRLLNDRLPQIIMSSQNSSVILGTERELNRMIQKYRGWLLQRPAEGQLNEMKTAFAQTGYGMAAEAFEWSEDYDKEFLPDTKKWFQELRKEYIGALGEMKVLSYEELRRVFLPVTQRLFRQVNHRIHEAEQAYLARYWENRLRPLGTELCRKLNELLQPFSEIYRTAISELEGLPDYFMLQEVDSEIQHFYWIHSPIPDGRTLGSDWNVMGYVDPVIQKSLSDYRDRRQEQVAQLIVQSKRRLNDQIQKIVRDVFARTADYVGRLQNGEEEKRVSSLLDRLEQLDKDGRELQEKFLAEAE